MWRILSLEKRINPIDPFSSPVLKCSRLEVLRGPHVWRKSFWSRFGVVFVDHFSGSKILVSGRGGTNSSWGGGAGCGSGRCSKSCDSERLETFKDWKIEFLAPFVPRSSPSNRDFFDQNFGLHIRAKMPPRKALILGAANYSFGTIGKCNSKDIFLLISIGFFLAGLQLSS